MRVFLLCLMLAGCAMSASLPQIREGMSQTQVRNVMGSPDSFKRSGNTSAMEYKNRLISGWSWDRADYSFIFINDRLTEWGAGQVRQVRQPQFPTPQFVIQSSRNNGFICRRVGGETHCQ